MKKSNTSSSSRHFTSLETKEQQARTWRKLGNIFAILVFTGTSLHLHISCIVEKSCSCNNFLQHETKGKKCDYYEEEPFLSNFIRVSLRRSKQSTTTTSSNSPQHSTSSALGRARLWWPTPVWPPVRAPFLARTARWTNVQSERRAQGVHDVAFFQHRRSTLRTMDVEAPCKRTFRWEKQQENKVKQQETTWETDWNM